MRIFLRWWQWLRASGAIRSWGRLLLTLGLIGLSSYALADDQAKDLLDGTAASLIKTLSGTGMKFVYLTEGIVSLAAYIKTKNLLVLSGIVVVSIFFNIVLHIVASP